ncbi:MAG TPA: GIY-YIG nuclease family protein [Bacilli bacterium]|nr:GIY-YIG nuclease family protein [Bacilli bacterium]
MDYNGYFVYMLRCSDHSLYTGFTTNIARRLAVHESGKGAKYTRGRGPFILEMVIQFESKTEALQAEYAIKQMTKQEKEQFILERKKTNEAAKEL